MAESVACHLEPIAVKRAAAQRNRAVIQPRLPSPMRAGEAARGVLSSLAAVYGCWYQHFGGPQAAGFSAGLVLVTVVWLALRFPETRSA